VVPVTPAHQKSPIPESLATFAGGVTPVISLEFEFDDEGPSDPEILENHHLEEEEDIEKE